MKVAPTPLRYSLTPTGVVFARKSNEPVALYTRIIKFDPGTFMENVRSANGGHQGGRSDQLEVRDFFAATGVDLAPPKTIFFNDREGTLVVRADLADLDKIEHSVAELNLQKQQINIKVKFVSSSVEPGARLWRAVGLTNAPGGHGSGFSAVLTPAQAAVLSKAFETSAGVELVNEASVTTLSGRETQIQTVDLKTIATNINPRALTPPGISSKDSKNDLYQTATVPFGPTLNIVAAVQADGQHIQLITDFQLIEPLSSSDSTNEVSIYIDGKRYAASQPSLHSRVAKAASNLIIADGQTLVLEAQMLDEPTSSLSTPESNKKWLLALVTPVVIDPAGNPLHSGPASSQPGPQK